MRYLLLAGLLFGCSARDVQAADDAEIYLGIGGMYGKKDDVTSSICSYEKPCFDFRFGVDKGRVDFWGSYNTLSGFQTNWRGIRGKEISYESLEYRVENYSVGLNFKLLLNKFIPYISLGTGVMLVHPRHRVSIPSKVSSYSIQHNSRVRSSVKIGGGLRWKVSENFALYGEAALWSSQAMRFSAVHSGLVIYKP